jgi:hypothetical protein
MIGKLNDEWERMCKKEGVAYFKSLFQYYLERQRKTTKSLNYDNQCAPTTRESNLGPLKYEGGVLSTQT